MSNNSGDEIGYPLDHMRQIAAAILVQASNDQLQHDQAWQQITHFIQNKFDPVLHDAVTGLLQPYAARLRATYDWQMDLASGLFDAIDLMDTTDHDVANTFTPQGSRNHLQ